MLSTAAPPKLPHALFLLLASSAILLVAWSIVVPIFEAPDEPHHWTYARYVHDHWSLPLYAWNFVEANQPPLYYWLIAPVSKNTELPESRAWLDATGVLRLACQPRFYKDCLSDLHRFRPIRRARLITVLFSILTVLFTFLAGREATGVDTTGLLAGALVAFLPQFTFRGSHLSNDALVAATCSVSTYLILRLIRRDFSWRTAFLASLCVSIAFLSKVNAIIFLPVLGGVLISGRLTALEKIKRLSVLLAAAVVVLPWLLRNQRLYGDLFASKIMLTTVPILVDKKSLWSLYFVTDFPILTVKSFVGVFGWMNVYLPPVCYYVFSVLVLIATAGCLRSVLTHKTGIRTVVVLCSLLLLALAETAQLNLTFDQPQGRYLFPALTASAVLTAIGLEACPGWNRGWLYLTVAVLAGINLYALFGVEWRTYWVPRVTPTLLTSDVVILPNLPPSPAGPLPPGGRFGQTFVAAGSNLSTVEIILATYNNKIPSGFIKFHLRATPEDVRDIVSASIPASTVVDNAFARFSFPPIGDSLGKSYYMFIETDGVPPRSLLTVYLSKSDVYPRGQFFINDKATNADMVFRTLETLGGVVCAECN